MNKAKDLHFQISAILPVLILFSLFYFIPIIVLVVTSFMEWDKLQIGGFAGFNNYIHLFTDPVDSRAFELAIKNNLSWTLFVIFIHIPLALVTALILHSKNKGWKIFRVLFFIPNIISITAIAIIFRQLFNPSYGVMNWLFEIMNIESMTDVNLLFHKTYGWYSIIATWILYIGFPTVVLLAELEAIPKELYESAQIEGATKGQEHVFITLPLLKNIIGTLCILLVTAGFREFERIYLLTGGAPEYRTGTLSLLVYEKMTYVQFAYSNSVGVFLLIIGVLFILIFNRLFKIGKSVYL